MLCYAMLGCVGKSLGKTGGQKEDMLGALVLWCLVVEMEQGFENRISL